MVCDQNREVYSPENKAGTSLSLSVSLSLSNVFCCRHHPLSDPFIGIMFGIGWVGSTEEWRRTKGSNIGSLGFGKISIAQHGGDIPVFVFSLGVNWD